jgi:hypothetical protein
MHEIDLLSAVQPPDGWFCSVGIKEGAAVRQQLVATRREFDIISADLVERGYNVYFGVAKYATDENRQKDNVQALKALWLDIDCGPAKVAVNAKTGRPAGYIDQTAGSAALRKFCKLVGLPKPLLVNSGRGLHVYWPLTEAITRGEWEPVAARLRELCTTHDLYVDPAVFEVARILRVPGTFNFKDDPPTEVSIIHDGDPHPIAELRDILGVKETKTFAPAAPRELSALAKSLMDNSVSRFSKIMRRSFQGNGCQQLVDCYENRAELEEPRWFDALSIAHHCVDRDKAIHKLSAGYADYDPAATEHKTRHIKGPHTCAVFERNNPGGCAGCPNMGKIKSPIVLGKEIIEATPEDNQVVVEFKDGTKEIFQIPEYPFPFFRGVNGGIYRKPIADEEEPLFVYENDLYVVKRMNDPILNDVVVMRLHLLHDGIREFALPMAKVMDVMELTKTLASYGVAAHRKSYALIFDLIMASVKNLQQHRKAEKMRLQFGWADQDSKFIIGDQEISASGVYHSPPSKVTSAIAAHMGPVGSLEKWKEVFALYGRPGLEPHAFAALTAFGAPLLRFLGQKGAIINVIHPTSGTGKTTILHMCNSVYGSPDRLCGVKDDTFNAKVMRVGVMNNLPVCMDEMTNLKAEDFSELVYNMSQGRGKDRVMASSNELRANLTSWQTLSLCSSNSSFYEKLAVYKNSPDGEMMRLLEYKIGFTGSIDPEHAKHMFDHQLLENYGHAGPIYAQWLVSNLEEAKSSALSVQQKIDRELKLTQRERFWSAAAAANITGGLIAKQLGLLDWDMKSIYRWATTEILSMRRDTAPPATDMASIVGDYINRHMQNILVVDDKLDMRSNKLKLPQLEPRGELLIRYEPDTKRMYFAAKAFKDDCVKYQVNYKETLRQLTASGVLLKNDNGGPVVNKRLSKGMKVAAPATSCLMLDCTRDEFINVDEFVKIEPVDGAGGS